MDPSYFTLALPQYVPPPPPPYYAEEGMTMVTPYDGVGIVARKDPKQQPPRTNDPYYVPPSDHAVQGVTEDVHVVYYAEEPAYGYTDGCGNGYPQQEHALEYPPAPTTYYDPYLGNPCADGTCQCPSCVAMYAIPAGPIHAQSRRVPRKAKPTKKASHNKGVPDECLFFRTAQCDHLLTCKFQYHPDGSYKGSCDMHHPELGQRLRTIPENYKAFSSLYDAHVPTRKWNRAVDFKNQVLKLYL